MGLPPRKAPRFGSTKDIWVGIPSQIGNAGCISGELSNHRFIGKGHLPLGQVVEKDEDGFTGSSFFKTRALKGRFLTRHT